MGRHNKLTDERGADSTDDTVTEVTGRPGHSGPLRWIAKVPLLPAIAGIGAMGVVTAAWSTSQISLNFTEGGLAQAPPPQVGAQGNADAPRGTGDQTSRSTRTSTVTVVFRAISRSETGFKATATIVNRDTEPINGWTLAFRIPGARVLSASNVVLVTPGSIATVRNLTQTPTIAPGRYVRVAFTARGTVGRPDACRFNDVPCTLA